ncbi:MAG: hypothetical protein QNJ97_13140 [Myxococcota bacterium]|nr:hypothetical protein [Myxococcota bacterium]
MSALGSLLVQDQIVGVAEIEQALEHQVIYGGDLATNLLELSLISESILTEYWARSIGLPALDPSLVDQADIHAIRKIPRSIADAHPVLPISVNDDLMVIAVDAPLSPDTREALAGVEHIDFEPRIVLGFRLAMGRNRYYGVPIPPRYKALQEELVPDFIADAPIQISALPPPPKTESKDPVSEKEFYVSLDEPTAETMPPEQPRERVQPKIATEGDAKAPFDLTAATQQLEAAPTRDAILELMLASAAEIFDFTALWVVQGTTAQGRAAVWRGDRSKKIDSLTVPLDKGGVFQIAFETRSFYLGPLSTSEVEEQVLSRLGRSWPKNCAVLPVTLRNRVILLLYADCGDQGVQSGQVSEFVHFLHAVGEAFEQLLLKQKYGAGKAMPSRPPLRPSEPPSVPPQQPAVPEDRPSLTASAGRYHLQGDEVTVARHSITDGIAETPRPQPPSGLISGSEGSEATSPAQKKAPSGEPAAGVIKSSVVMIKGSPRATPSPTDPVKTDTSVSAPAASGVTSSTVVSIGPSHRPQSVVVEMKEEIDRLVERVLVTTRFDEIAADLLVGIGDDALVRLIAEFPGPLTRDRYQEADRLGRVADHGPLLRALLKFGKKAVPHLLPLFESPDSDVRFYATFIFSELIYPEAIGTLTARLFDNDGQIRTLTLNVIHQFKQYPEYKWAMREVAGVLKSSHFSVEAKRIAGQALGELREPSGVRELIEMLESIDENLVTRCHRALVRITFNDFGFSSGRWQTWLSSNRRRHRVEWAIDSVVHPKEAIRNAAIQELGDMVGDVVQKPQGPLDHKQRLDLQRRLTEWWQREGRALYPYREGD